jgi:hypothetical protein
VSYLSYKGGIKMAEKRDKEITAESLNIVDKAGNTRIKLFVNAEGTPRVSFLQLGREIKANNGYF